MGTRNLTMVVSGGKTKVAQYGQWDGYPEGQGATALDFLKNADLSDFRKKVDAARELTDVEAEEIGKCVNWQRTHPHLSRDAGGKILELIMAAPLGLPLVLSEEFAKDSLMCEWGYM